MGPQITGGRMRDVYGAASIENVEITGSAVYSSEGWNSNAENSDEPNHLVYADEYQTAAARGQRAPAIVPTQVIIEESFT